MNGRGSNRVEPKVVPDLSFAGLVEIEGNAVPFSFGVAASAVYPVFFPAFDRTFRITKRGETKHHRVSRTDRSVYNNLGIQVLEPGRAPKVSLHTFPCDCIISCNTGRGQEGGVVVPLRFCSRVKRAFEVMRTSTVLRRRGIIKGFVMPRGSAKLLAIDLLLQRNSCRTHG